MNNPATNNYDSVSLYYDGLGALVFAGALLRSQSHFLSRLPAGGRVLLVGGGTGKILEHLARIHPQKLDVVYVELSQKMLALSQRRRVGSHAVTFVHASIEDFRDETGFDAVITPFLFDNFLPEKAAAIHTRISGMLRPGGHWLYTDFVPHAAGWQKGLLHSMYLFFGLTVHIEAKALPDMAPCFLDAYRTVDSNTFYAGFINSVLYEKV